jgi:hypothetical protein
LRAGFPHSDICGSMLYCQLPAAFRRLTRLSSPVIAKASIICTYSLDPITLSPQPSLIKDATSNFVSRLCPHLSDLNRLGLIQSKPMFFSIRSHRFPRDHVCVNHFLYFFQIVKELLFLSAKADTKTSRLSYRFLLPRFEILVEVDGIEPTTPCLQSRCSPS